MPLVISGYGSKKLTRETCAIPEITISGNVPEDQASASVSSNSPHSSLPARGLNPAHPQSPKSFTQNTDIILE
jgi:hypothetical protein